MNTADLLPRRGERAVFVGQTGSGKTTLARTLLRSRQYVVVFDVKGNLTWDGYERHTSLATLTKSKAPRLIYRPRWEELQDPDEIEAFFSWVYQCRNRTVYVDELMGICSGDVYPPHFGACLTRGRELGIDVWSATQRPKRIPMVAMSEAENTYMFYLKLSQDRERMSELTGIDPDAIATLPKFDFLFSRQDGGTQGPLRLERAA